MKKRLNLIYDYEYSGLPSKYQISRVIKDIIDSLKKNHVDTLWLSLPEDSSKIGKQ
jgi:hypothetical protein